LMEMELKEPTDARIVSIAVKPEDGESRPRDRYSRMAVSSATLAPRQGIVGDAKGSAGGRQLNIMSAETLAELKGEGFQTAPGDMGEQLVLAGVPVETLTIGARLRLGTDAVVEVGIPRTGCGRFERIQGRSKSAVAGRLGVMAKVIVGGAIAVGDSVSILEEDA
jgi:MOSC domain-containing protein YiiM